MKKLITLIAILIVSVVAKAQPGVTIPGNAAPRYSFNSPLYIYYGGSFHTAMAKDSADLMYLKKSNNLSDLTNTATALSNLGVTALLADKVSYSAALSSVIPNTSLAIDLGSGTKLFNVIYNRTTLLDAIRPSINSYISFQNGGGTTTYGRWYLNGTGNILFQAGGTLADNNVDIGQFTGTVMSGKPGTLSGGYRLAGGTSGTISILPQTVAGTYNFNMPITAGTSGYFLTSGGGGSTAMSWTQNNFLTTAGGSLSGQLNGTAFQVGLSTTVDYGYLSNSDFKLIRGSLGSNYHWKANYDVMGWNYGTYAQYILPSATISSGSLNLSMPSKTGNQTIATLSDITSGVTSVSGTMNRVTITGTTTPVIDISASYAGQSSITTLGTIGAGTWQGTAIADTYISSASTWNAKQTALSGAGLVKFTGTTPSYITDNSSNWNTAYSERNQWDGGATGLTAATGRASLGLVIGTDVLAPTGNGSGLTNINLSTNTSGLSGGIRNITSATTITNSDFTINITGGGTFSQPLPSAPNTGQVFYIVNNGAGVITVTATSIMGGGSTMLPGGQTGRFQYTGTSGTYVIL